MARIYTNENFRFSIVVKLRELGNDVFTALEAGNANKSIPDTEGQANRIHQAIQQENTLYGKLIRVNIPYN